MNARIPVAVSDAIDHMASALGCSKTALVIALFEEGLHVAAEALHDWQRPSSPPPPLAQQCTVPGCKRAKVAKGLCATHYQAERRRGLR